MKLYKAYLVDCSKGPAVFLDHTKALEYVGKWGGVLIHLSGTDNVKETCHNSVDIRPQGKASEPRAQLIHEDTSNTSAGSNGSGTAGQNLPTCGDSCPRPIEGLEQSLQACNDTVQCTGNAC